MSKSLKRVRAALIAAGIPEDIAETPLARTALDAATALGCAVDQIGKSIIFKGQDDNRAVLFVTAGGNRVDETKAAACAGQPLGKACAALIRSQTGFAIGGVSPLGHLNPITAYFDARLLDFDRIWVAAGTPHHVFAVAPAKLLAACGGTVVDFTE